MEDSKYRKNRFWMNRVMNGSIHVIKGMQEMIHTESTLKKEISYKKFEKNGREFILKMWLPTKTNTATKTSVAARIVCTAGLDSFAFRIAFIA